MVGRYIEIRGYLIGLTFGGGGNGNLWTLSYVHTMVRGFVYGIPGENGDLTLLKRCDILILGGDKCLR